jgi:5,5'-dehydrodivanillate O-demethylase oxygenase subunit
MTNYSHATDNIHLGETGKGTPMGEMLRRYWWPVGISADLLLKPTLIRLLGEDLVLFRDSDGRPGLVGAKCPHRHANLCLGNTVKGGLRCRYHGWLIDQEGHVRDTPGEPDQNFKHTIRHDAYPVEELGGLIFAYIGPAPAPAPALPRFSFLAAPGERFVKVTGFADCHWLQAIENGMDPIHLSFTHAPSLPGLRNTPEVWFEETPWGVAYFSSRPTPDRSTNHVRIHNLLLPAISCTGSLEPFITQSAGSVDTPISARWAVPIDDTHCMMIRVIFKPEGHPGHWRDDVPEETRWDLPWQGIPIHPYREYREAAGNEVKLGYTVPRGVTPEDAAVVGSIGPRIDHAAEKLMPTGDEGLAMVRRIYHENVAAVQAGGDPKGTVRDGAQALIRPLVGERFVADDELQRMRSTRDISTNLEI